MSHNRLSAEVRYGTLHLFVDKASDIEVIIAFRLKSAMGLYPGAPDAPWDMTS